MDSWRILLRQTIDSGAVPCYTPVDRTIRTFYGTGGAPVEHSSGSNQTTATEVGIDPVPRLRPGPPKAAPCPCGEPHFARGLCYKHYKRLYARERRARLKAASQADPDAF